MWCSLQSASDGPAILFFGDLVNERISERLLRSETSATNGMILERSNQNDVRIHSRMFMSGADRCRAWPRSPIVEGFQKLLDGLLLRRNIAVQRGVSAIAPAPSPTMSSLLDGGMPGGGIRRGDRRFRCEGFQSLAIWLGHDLPSFSSDYSSEGFVRDEGSDGQTPVCSSHPKAWTVRGKLTQMRRPSAAAPARAAATRRRPPNRAARASASRSGRILLDAANQELGPTAEMLLYFAGREHPLDEWITLALAEGKIARLGPVHLLQRFYQTAWGWARKPAG